MNSLPNVTKNLLIINVLMFLATWAGERYGIDLSKYLGLHFILSDRFNAAQFFTYMFMHANFLHLFFNMFALWMFGRILEMVWGPKRFLFYFLVCGVGAGILQELVAGIYYHLLVTDLPPEMVQAVLQNGSKALEQNMNYVHGGMAALNLTLNNATVGASGAIYGVLLAFGMLFPNEKMFIFPIPVPIKAKWFVLGYVFIELFAAAMGDPNDNVAHFAHLGGMLFGFMLIYYWKKKNKGNDHDYYYFD